MKKIFLIILLIFLIIVVFTPGLKTLDRLITPKEKIDLWEKNAIEGDITATSNLIVFYESKVEQEKWLALYKEQRKKRKNEYMDLKKKSEEGNTTATLKLQELRGISYF